MIEPHLEPEKYSDGIFELCVPGSNKLDHNTYARIISKPDLVDELVSCLIRNSMGRVTSRMCAGLCKAIPTVSIQLFADFRDGRIHFKDLKLESLGLDHRQFLNSE